MREYHVTAMALLEAGTAHVVITMTGVRGEAPGDPGCKSIVTAGGLCWGTVGGGKIEARAIQHAQLLLKTSAENTAHSPLTVECTTWNLQRDIGMTCGGEVTFLFELVRPRAWHVVIFGAGHVAQALARVLLTLPCHIDCVDSRAEWLKKLPESEKLVATCHPRPEETVPSFGGQAFYVVVTQGHATDVPILSAILKTTAPYVGAIGSPLKANKIKGELRALGVTKDRISVLRCPVGLPLGSNQPAEIAISIAAEMLMVRGGQSTAVIEDRLVT